MQTIDIPDAALARCLEAVRPALSRRLGQVMDGMDGMMRMPGGCFEQTSSSAYPNILVVDYIKKTKMASPQMLLKAEQYLNVGYQRCSPSNGPAAASTGGAAASRSSG